MSAEVLTKAKALLTPEQFAQMAFAKDERDEMVDPTHPRACKWCAVGAVLRVGHVHSSRAEYAPRPVLRALFLLAQQADPETSWEDSVDYFIMTIACVNDRAGMKNDRPDLAFKAVHKLYDEAIKQAEQRSERREVAA